MYYILYLTFNSRFTTHVISAILNIGQSVTKEWELHILDNTGAAHAVTLQPGEMLWYESARLLHGRPDPLDGYYFDNLFIHYKPTNLWYSQQAEVTVLQVIATKYIREIIMISSDSSQETIQYLWRR